MKTVHEPVLLKEVLAYLDPKPGKNYIDCTFGGGGHSLAILERIKPEGKLIGIDWDKRTVQSSQAENLILVNDNYKNLKKIIEDNKKKVDAEKFDGILIDLGFSSDQIESNRGFSFQDQGLLDLRYDSEGDRPTAAEILQTADQKELFEIFKNYGEEPLAWPIAKAIVESRENGEALETAEMLVQLVSNVYRRKYKSASRKNPATKVFQALRIAVNDEYGNINTVMPQAIEALKPGGRLAIISFHSGEDRIVKHYFKNQALKKRIKIITKKPVEATDEEVENNPRSRSAKLRIIEKI